jgi:hypothetical protein
VELFRTRFGHYPEAVYVDQIYRTRSNRAYCRNLGVRITAPPLGRPVPDDLAVIRKQYSLTGYQKIVAGMLTHLWLG